MKLMQLASAVAAGAGMAVIVAACSSSPNTASAPTGAPGGTPGESATPATGAGGGPSAPAPTGTAASPGAAPATGTAAPACRSSDLKVTLGTSGAAAGSVYTQIDFTNISSAGCTLKGYPGVATTTGTTPGSQVGPAATRSGTRPVTLVTLAPGAVGNALLQFVDVLNYTPSACDVASTAYLQVYPPGLTTPVYLPYKAKTCTRHQFVIGIAAVKAGTGP